MGEIADMCYDMALEQMCEVQKEIIEILKSNNNDKLFLLTDDSDDELVMGIRDYYEKYKTLSKKQRYCLARFICQQY
tara:strand:+ start:81 stop:311 length:231 start_codon:yes stop_codon:yes gene_type:complete